MSHELARLQMITLGSIVVLILLCVVLIGLVWLALNLIEMANCLERMIERVFRSKRPFSPGQRVYAKDEFVVDAGLGQTVASGVEIDLLDCHVTSQGIRWSGMCHGMRIPYLSEDLITDVCPD